MYPYIDCFGWANMDGTVTIGYRIFLDKIHAIEYPNWEIVEKSWPNKFKKPRSLRQEGTPIKLGANGWPIP